MDRGRSRSREGPSLPSHNPEVRRSASPPHRSKRHHSRSPSRSRSPKHATSRRDRRSRSRSPKRSTRPKRRHSRSRSRGRSSDSSGNESARSRERRKRKDKHKEKKRHRSRSRSRSRERRERRERKKEKKEKKKNKTLAVTSQWGKYGVINESDMYNKEQEFRAWLIEELVINPETLSKDASRKKFAQFVEDYNTATLPHEKYYALEPYERRMTSLRNGHMVPQGDESAYDPMADIAAHSSRHKQPVTTNTSETYLNKEQLQELRRVQMQRIEAGKMKVLGMEIKQSMGVRMDGTHFD